MTQEAPPEDPARTPATDVAGEALPSGDVAARRTSLLEHLQELRRRLRNAAIAFMLALILSFVFVKKFFLYNLSTLLVWLIERSRRKREAAIDAGLVH